MMLICFASLLDSEGEKKNKVSQQIHPRISSQVRLNVSLWYSRLLIELVFIIPYSTHGITFTAPSGHGMQLIILQR